MALHGRPVGQPETRSAPLPAVHSSSSSSSPPTPPVSLDRPRPGAARAANLYSRAPEAADRARADCAEAERLAPRGLASPAKRGERNRGGPGVEKTPAAEKSRTRDPAPQKRPVCDQPAPLKPNCAAAGATRSSDSEPAADSIMCPVCGRCRCEACRTPRALPQRLLCGRTCLLSADTCVDWASCMCCVKAAAYHCAASDSGSRAADRPCSCSPAGGGCCLRWTALLLITTVVPCLACYWPLRAAARLAQTCYSRGGDGCACPARDSAPRGRETVARRADRPPVCDPPRLCARD